MQYDKTCRKNQNILIYPTSLIETIRFFSLTYFPFPGTGTTKPLISIFPVKLKSAGVKS